MCKLVKECYTCKGCSATPNCRLVGKAGEHIKACPAQQEGRPADCPNNGRPDPNDVQQVEKMIIGKYTCQACQDSIREYRRRLQEAGYS